jgi:hypothetical protein
MWAKHVQQLGGESPLPSLMETKGSLVKGKGEITPAARRGVKEARSKGTSR